MELSNQDNSQSHEVELDLDAQPPRAKRAKRKKGALPRNRAARCQICFDSFNALKDEAYYNGLAVTQCGHCVCYVCLVELQYRDQMDCFVCRAPFVIDYRIVIKLKLPTPVVESGLSKIARRARLMKSQVPKCISCGRSSAMLTHMKVPLMISMRCGHLTCDTCVKKAIKQNELRCSECKELHALEYENLIRTFF